MLAALRTLIGYEAVIVPHAHRELRRWERIAASIPDRALRGHATGAIAVDTGNAVAIAALAATAPRRVRRTTVELLVTYQVLVDYVDRLGERACADRFLRGLAVGLALAAAVAAPATPIDVEPLGDDGGYLAGLVAACRDLLWQLPSAAVVAQPARAAATRCAHALAYTHSAAEQGSPDRLRRWANAQEDTAAYAWWETAAGATSNIAVSALLAAAADPATTRRDVAAITAAYWPHICVLSTMLDSLVDYERDARSGDFSFVSHYPNRAAVRHGLVATAAHALRATRSLPRRRTHAMIVCGIVGHYATTATGETLASQIAPSVLDGLRPAATPVVLALRAQHGLRSRRRA